MPRKKLEEIRHPKCNSLLLEGKGTCDIEIWCSSCRSMIYPSRGPAEMVEWPKGKDFLNDRTSLAHRCRHCHRLQFLSRNGEGIYKVRCRYCKRDTYHNTIDIRAGKKQFLGKESIKNRENLAW